MSQVALSGLKFSRALAQAEAARSRRLGGSAGGPARPGLPPLTHAARAAILRGAQRGRSRSPVGRPGPQRGGGLARGAPGRVERSAGPRASMCMLAAAGELSARAPQPRGPAGTGGQRRPSSGGPSGPRRR